MPPLVLKLYNPHAYWTLFRVVVHWGSLPAGTVLAIGLNTKGFRTDHSKADHPPPGAIEGSCGEFARPEEFQMFELTREKKSSVLPEVLIRPERPALLLITALVPQQQQSAGPPTQFDLVQMEGRRVTGGCTVVLGQESAEDIGTNSCANFVKAK
jgi:hypothetical protein